MVTKDFDIQRYAFLNGHITEKEWVEFCNSILNKLLVENKETMIRLKEI